MVFNNDVLFLHFGKAAGTSVTHYLCKSLKSPVYHVVPGKDIELIKKIGNEEILSWKRHGNLVETAAFLSERGIALSDFKIIIVIVRNPFELDFSYYKHLQKPKVIEYLSVNNRSKKLLEAASCAYNEFAKMHFTHHNGDLADFFEINGTTPKNLHVVKLEELNQTLPRLIKPYSINDVLLPRLNKSDHTSIPEPLSDDALISIRNKYEYICKNFYPEMKVPETSDFEGSASDEKKYLFIGGCGRSDTSVLTAIIGSHQQIVLGNERYNTLMNKNSFGLSKAHFTKERFLTIQNGDTFYDEFKMFKAHMGIAEKFDDAVYVGVKHPQFDRIFHLMKQQFSDFKYLYIYRNIMDVAESWNRRAEKGGNWPQDKNYLKAVERWNHSLCNTLKLLKNGADIICIHYDDLLFSNKSIQPIFDRLSIPIDDNVLNMLARARKIAPEKKSEKRTLAENEVEYINNNARFELYDEIHSKYNILR